MTSPDVPPVRTADPRTWVGASVVGSRGELLGYLGPVYPDNATGRPAWAVVHGTRQTAVVPLEMSRFDGTALRLPFGDEKLSTAPHRDPAGRISDEDGADLYRHYGLLPPTPEAGAMVRSEERLSVGTETVVAGRLRMRKYLVTEEQTVTVPVTREEIAFDFEEIPPDAQVPDPGGTLAEDTYEVIRYEERVVVTTQLVPVERVRLVRRVVTTEQSVTGRVRRELIDLEQTGAPARPVSAVRPPDQQ